LEKKFCEESVWDQDEGKGVTWGRGELRGEKRYNLLRGENVDLVLGGESPNAGTSTKCGEKV